MKKKIGWFFIFLVCLTVVCARMIHLDHTTKIAKWQKDEIVMDRHTLSDYLVSIFGEKAKPIVLQTIFNIGAPIGGGCDYYSMNYDEKQKLVDPFTLCPSRLRDINAPMYVKMNSLRNAAVDKACRNLTADEEIVAHALKISQLKMNDPLSLENIEKLHFTFHKSPLEEEHDALYSQWVSAHPNSSWPELAYAICTSPSWQIL